jgi:hypothetical protein
VAAHVPVDEGPAPAWVDRAVALLVAAAGIAAVVALARITPDPRGYGTHEQLGLAECGWPQRYGMPCPTCGVTTAACWLVHLSPWRALATQPFGAALALAGLAAVTAALLDLARGRSFLVRAYTFRLGRWLLGGLALLLGAWWYKARVAG